MKNQDNQDKRDYAERELSQLIRRRMIARNHGSKKTDYKRSSYKKGLGDLD